MYDKHLDTFIKVADLGSFSKAAEQLYISPNAVIKQMNLLENDIGITLFERTNHGVKLTEAGKSIYHDAKRIIRISQQSIETAKNILRPKTNVIRIGTSLLRPCKSFVNYWITVSQDYPDIELRIVPFDDNKESWLKLLSNLGNEIDVVAGIYPSTLWGNRCQVLKLSDQPLCLAVSRKNPLSNKKIIRYSDLAGENLIMVERGDTSFIDAVRNEMEEKHPEIHIQDVPSYGTEVFNQCENSGSTMLTISNWSDIHPSLVTIPFECGFSVPYGLMYSLNPSSLVEQFVDILSKQ